MRYALLAAVLACAPDPFAGRVEADAAVALFRGQQAPDTYVMCRGEPGTLGWRVYCHAQRQVGSDFSVVCTRYGCAP